MRFSAAILAVSTLAFMVNCNRASATDERMVDSQAMTALIGHHEPFRCPALRTFWGAAFH